MNLFSNKAVLPLHENSLISQGGIGLNRLHADGVTVYHGWTSFFRGLVFV